MHNLSILLRCDSTTRPILARVALTISLTSEKGSMCRKREFIFDATSQNAGWPTFAFLDQTEIKLEIKADIRLICDYRDTVIDFFSPESQLSDVRVHVGEKTFQLNKSYLAHYSRYFKAAFFSNCAEKEKEEVDLPNIDANEFEELLRMIYPQAVRGKVVPYTSTPYSSDCICDGCKCKITGKRFKCLICVDYDLCPECEQQQLHAVHAMMRVNGDDTMVPSPPPPGAMPFSLLREMSSHRLSLSVFYSQNSVGMPASEPAIERISLKSNEVQQSNVEHILRLADYFDVPLVLCKCIEFLRETDAFSLAAKLLLTDIYRLPELQYDILKNIKFAFHAEAVIASSEFASYSEPLKIHILQMHFKLMKIEKIVHGQ